MWTNLSQIITIELIKGCFDMKKYNSEFKSMIVELYKTGCSVKDFSREYEISEVTIYK